MNAANYTKRTHREHILELPDTYIGSVDTEQQARWIWDPAVSRMVWKKVAFCPGFFKIFDEILVNALDHYVRQQCRVKAGDKDINPVTQIRISITPTQITVLNDGDSIPLVQHPEHKCTIPELIFGQLLTSSNYNKEEEKIVGGKNGYGAKLTNIFSSEFSVQVVNQASKMHATYKWLDNMSSMAKPKIVGLKNSMPSSTTIAYKPDLTRFHWSEDGVVPDSIPVDMLSVLITRCYDAAFCVPKCKVYLNNELLNVGSMPAYMELFAPLEDALPDSIRKLTPKKRSEALFGFESAGERWEIGAVLTHHLYKDNAPEDRHVSFVNGICTRRGGKHIDYIAKHALNDFCALAKKKSKLDLTPAMLKDSIVWFVRCSVVNPSFDTQTKEYLTTPASKFGSTPSISAKFVESLVRIGLLDEAQHILDARLMKEAKKSDGKKRASVRGIPKLEDALWAGAAKSSECTLILTEGDSAASTAISGLKVVGREKYGVFPLRGKLLNVKDAAMAKKTGNKELNEIKQILGLEYGKKYNSLAQLRYGRVMIMTDQDVDGSHIKGLLVNLFHTEWPALLQMGFLCCLMTPLIKATKGSQVLSFYSESEYESWRSALTETETKGWKIKYYKGLGTSTSTEAREYFEHMHTVDFTWDDEANNNIDLAFNKKRSDDRKTWLGTYDAKRVLQVPAGGAKVPLTRFIHDELIHFSSADNIRSIPSVFDGMKPAQRKILWACLKRGLTQEIRVAQLAGYVSEVAAYHHGEASLTATIVGMAQDFVGSNNLNLLTPNGQFGTRLMGGKDAASPRYIHTHLKDLTKRIIRKEDEPILDHVDDDGTPVEPKNYLPTVPLLLINGSIGIGTGFSTEVLPHDPAELVKLIKARISGDIATLEGRRIKPWWCGFRGTVTEQEDKKGWITQGIADFVDDDKHIIRIKELPVGLWTRDYKEFLEQLLAGEMKGFDDLGGKATLKNFEEAYNDIDVDFIITLTEDAYWNAKAYPAEFMQKFRLINTYRETNMVAFDTQGKIRRYKTAGDMLEEFVEARLTAYSKRKTHLLAQYVKQLIELKARMKFVQSVIDGTLVVARVSDETLLTNLRKLELPTLSTPGQVNAGLEGYEYLLRMRIDRLKESSVKQLQDEITEIEKNKTTLETTSLENLWENDLDEFLSGWMSYTKEREATYKPSDGTLVNQKNKKKSATASKRKN